MLIVKLKQMSNFVEFSHEQHQQLANMIIYDFRELKGVAAEQQNFMDKVIASHQQVISEIRDLSNRVKQMESYAKKRCNKAVSDRQSDFGAELGITEITESEILPEMKIAEDWDREDERFKVHFN